MHSHKEYRKNINSPSKGAGPYSEKRVKNFNIYIDMIPPHTFE